MEEKNYTVRINAINNGTREINELVGKLIELNTLLLDRSEYLLLSQKQLYKQLQEDNVDMELLLNTESTIKDTRKQINGLLAYVPMWDIPNWKPVKWDVSML